MQDEKIRRRLTAARERLLTLKEGLARGGPDTQVTTLSELGGHDQHPADIATETFERSKDLSILLGIEVGLAEVDRAADRLGSGTYGICEACGTPIAPGRLEILPAARFCTTDQARMERESGGSGSAVSGYGYLAQVE
jgi:DnaK suppressor protein